MSLWCLTLAPAWMAVSFPEMGSPRGEAGGKTRTVVWAILNLSAEEGLSRGRWGCKSETEADGIALGLTSLESVSKIFGREDMCQGGVLREGD